MEKYSYDIEIFPNFFSVIFIDIFSDKEFTFYVFKEDTDNIVYRKLTSFVKQKYLIGYNNSRFDDILINKILKDKKIDVKDLYRSAQDIISLQNLNKPLWKHDEFKWILKPYKRTYKSIDLMRVLAFDKMRIGLKQCSVNLKHDLIQDLPKKHYEFVEEHEIDNILSYNKNDVIITKKLFFEVKDDLVLRHTIGNEYEVNLMNSSNTHIGKTILNYYYEKETGIDYNDFKSLRTYRRKIDFKDCISDIIEFKTPKFNNMLDDLKSISVSKTKGAIDYKLLHNGKGYQLGTGGLHSIDEPAIFEETDEYYIIDCDVASMYPNIMLNLEIKPEHLSDVFFDILRGLTKRRLEAKRIKDMSTSDALKISINSIYGLLNFENYWLYDPQSAISVTINGQLLLLMLIERLEKAGFEVISANTDGVTAKVIKHRLNEYYDICKQWEKDTMFELEYAFYSHYIRRDVNNYLTKIRKIVEKGQSFNVDKVKKKGCFVDKIELHKAFKQPIVPIALEKYYIEGKPISETLREHDDILDFCKSQRVGSQFQVEHHITEKEEEGYLTKVLPLQKTNRYFVSNNGGTLLKRNEKEELTNVEAGYLTTILNNYDKENIYLKDVNFNYYERECDKIINAVSQNGQLKLI